MRVLSGVFATASILAGTWFVIELQRGRVRIDLAFLIVLFGVCAAGLWRRTSWGRGLAILVCLWNAGLGLLAIAGTAPRPDALVPAAFMAANVAAVAVLARSRRLGGA